MNLAAAAPVARRIFSVVAWALLCTTLVPVGAAVLIGCAERRAGPMHESEPRRGDAATSLGRPSAASRSADFAAADRILMGFDSAQPRPDWQPGDRLLWGVRLEEDGRSRTWYVLTRVERTGVQPGARVSLGASDCGQHDSATRVVDGSQARRPEVGGAASSSTIQVAAPPMAGRTLVAPAASELPGQWKARELGRSLSYTLVRIDVYDEHASAMGSTHQFLSEHFADASLYQSCASVLRCLAAREKPTATEIQ
jgi:hypothetical protein